MRSARRLLPGLLVPAALAAALAAAAPPRSAPARGPERVPHPDRDEGAESLVRGTKSNRQGIGARVTIETEAGRQVREVKAGESYLSSRATLESTSAPAPRPR